MDPKVEDAWTKLLTHIATQGIDAITERTCKLSTGCVGARAIEIGSAYVVECLHRLVQLTEPDALTSELCTFLKQMAGSSLWLRHRNSALLQLTETLGVLLRDRGKTLIRSELTTLMLGVSSPLQRGMLQRAVEHVAGWGGPAAVRRVEGAILGLMSPECSDRVYAMTVLIVCNRLLQGEQVKALLHSVLPMHLEPSLVRRLDHACCWT
jgi:hypothetical protein